MMFDDTPCELGEGVLWHDGRQSLFWFDILNRKLFEKTLDGELTVRTFDRLTSAAGIIDDTRLFVASEAALSVLDLSTGDLTDVVPLEADNPVTRSNDGRADPFGGFWIGTMGKKAEAGAGSIWRYYKGELRQLFDNLTITNSICFSPDGDIAYFADTAAGQIMKVTLDEAGWPAAEPTLFVDLRDEGLNPDGAVTDSQGNVWSAQWGASRVACYSPDGGFVEAKMFPASQMSCPAFGGPDLTTLFATSAREGMANPSDSDGAVYQAAMSVAGIRSPRVLLG